MSTIPWGPNDTQAALAIAGELVRLGDPQGAAWLRSVAQRPDAGAPAAPESLAAPSDGSSAVSRRGRAYGESLREERAPKWRTKR